MDVIMAVTRALLVSLEEDDHEMSALYAKSFLTLNEFYYPEV